MKNIIFTAIFALTSFGMAQAAEITMSDLDDLQRADVYILGETHDNALHHLGQVRAIKALQPKAVVFEMLTPRQAALITPDLLADQTALEAALGWNASGWPDFAIYYPVFAALDGVKIYGAALPKDEVRRAYAEGAATVFGGDAAKFGLDQAVPEDQLGKRMQEQFDAHCAAMPLTMMGGMVEAQRIRDAAFADAVIKAYEDAGGSVILIAGAGHAHYDWAVPTMLKKAGEKLSVISIAFLEEPAEPEKRYDFWIETERAIREDPCLAFQK